MILIANDDHTVLESIHALSYRPGSCNTGVDNDCYLVDHASSHMLVLKIKPYIWHGPTKIRGGKDRSLNTLVEHHLIDCGRERVPLEYFSICALQKLACELPIQPVLKDEPRSLTYVRVNGRVNPLGVRKIIGGIPLSGAPPMDLHHLRMV
ncbi:hypothetical protein BC332_14915 [Capsicum chinense]|nr:hypothetical protein BC332_14915 [Capsicum chinense]